MVDSTDKNYAGQSCVGSKALKFPEFSERLRNRADQVLNESDPQRIAQIKAELSQMAIVQSGLELDPHQALLYLEKVQERHPGVPNPSYHELIGSAWKVENRDPELYQRFIVACTNSPPLGG